jgi:hypothetical protein
MSGATIQHFAAARVGDSLGVHAWITGNYEHKGHLFLDHSTRWRSTMSDRSPGSRISRSTAQGSSRRREKRTAPANVPSDENRIFGNTQRPRGVVNAKSGYDKR